MAPPASNMTPGQMLDMMNAINGQQNLQPRQRVVQHAPSPPPVATREIIKEVPRDIIKEVPFEVIKEVQVPFEVIKEVQVPVEVIKEVQVPVEVIKFVDKEVRRGAETWAWAV